MLQQQPDGNCGETAFAPKLRIKTPADVSALEGTLLKTAYAGHWHDAKVRVDGDAILVSYRDEEKISGLCENRSETTGRI